MSNQSEGKSILRPRDRLLIYRKEFRKYEIDCFIESPDSLKSITIKVPEIVDSESEEILKEGHRWTIDAGDRKQEITKNRTTRIGLGFTPSLFLRDFYVYGFDLFGAYKLGENLSAKLQISNGVVAQQGFGTLGNLAPESKFSYVTLGIQKSLTDLFFMEGGLGYRQVRVNVRDHANGCERTESEDCDENLGVIDTASLGPYFNIGLKFQLGGAPLSMGILTQVFAPIATYRESHSHTESSSVDELSHISKATAKAPHGSFSAFFEFAF